MMIIPLIVGAVISGVTTEALAYVAGPRMLIEDEEWNLNDWKLYHREEFLKRL